SGLVPVPLWIPQIGMALGVILFAVAIVEDLVRAILGHQTLFDAAERKLKDAQEAGEPVDPV
ncbi:hypothetical protein H2O73_21700, partial [Vibrio sp. 404]|nr:hypothetical protein [Vibrio marinisediminis]